MVRQRVLLIHKPIYFVITYIYIYICVHGWISVGGNCNDFSPLVFLHQVWKNGKMTIPKKKLVPLVRDNSTQWIIMMGVKKKIAVYSRTVWMYFASSLFLFFWMHR